MSGSICRAQSHTAPRGSTLSGVAAIALLVCGACSFNARSADAYRDATRALLESKNADIQTCHEAWLKKNEAAAGTVVLTFKVKAKTGKLAGVTVDRAQTTASKNLIRCVLRAVDDLALDPPDEREGEASFRWEFQVPG